MADIVLRLPINGNIRFNSPIGPRDGREHFGTDWAAQLRGTPGDVMVAMADGKVVAQYFSQSFGNVAIVETMLPTGKYLYQLFAHLDRFAYDSNAVYSQEPPQVAAGELVGYMGGTPNYPVHGHTDTIVADSRIAFTRSMLFPSGASGTIKQSGVDVSWERTPTQTFLLPNGMLVTSGNGQFNIKGSNDQTLLLPDAFGFDADQLGLTVPLSVSREGVRNANAPWVELKLGNDGVYQLYVNGSRSFKTWPAVPWGSATVDLSGMLMLNSPWFQDLSTTVKVGSNGFVLDFNQRYPDGSISTLPSSLTLGWIPSIAVGGFTADANGRYKYDLGGSGNSLLIKPDGSVDMMNGALQILRSWGVGKLGSIEQSPSGITTVGEVVQSGSTGSLLAQYGLDIVNGVLTALGSFSFVNSANAAEAQSASNAAADAAALQSAVGMKVGVTTLPASTVADNSRLQAGATNLGVSQQQTSAFPDPQPGAPGGFGFNTGDSFGGTPIINTDGLLGVAQSYLVTGNIRPGAQQTQAIISDLWMRIDTDGGSASLGTPVTDPIPYLSDTLRYSAFNAGANAIQNIDPLVLDLDGDGVELSSWIEKNIFFDTVGDGKLHQTGWVADKDGILSLDLNGNGKIDDITETLSVHFNAGATPKNYVDGIAALASLAQAGATAFSRATSRTNNATGHLYFDDLRVWIDANHDAKTDAGELKSLDQLGITSISLVGSGNLGEAIAGNDVMNRTTFERSNGSTGQVASIDFQVEGASLSTTNVIGATVIKSEGSATVLSYAVTDLTGRSINASTFTLADGSHPTAFYSTGGNDSFIVNASDTRGYWLGGGTGSLTLKGGAGSDVLLINANTLQANIDGGGGFDIVKVNDVRGVTLNLAIAHVEEALGDIGNDTFNASGTTSSVFLDGGGGNDILIGGIANDAIGGGKGDDYIDGGRGNDVLRGGDGDDLIFGGEGDDIVFGEAGNDTLIGGAVSGSAGANVMEGGDGDDILIGTGGFTVASYRGSFGDYNFTRNADGTVTITDSHADRDGTDTLKDISALDFADVSQVAMVTTLSNFGYGMPVDDRVDVSGAGPYVIAASQLLANDKNYAGSAMSIRELLSVSGASIARGASGQVVGGTAALSADGSSITFTPAVGFTGVMKFKYHVQDATGKTGTIVRQIGTTSSAEMAGTAYLHTPDQPTERLFDQQWYLPQVNLLPVWKDYTGRGVSIGVFEPSGNVDLTHPDLAPNAGQSIKANGQLGVDQIGLHATLVAGIIGAARDGEGVVGVAYDATISSISLPPSIDSGDVPSMQLWPNYDIVNNSWSFTEPFADSFLYDASYEGLYYSAAALGRGGKGTVLIFGAGNERGARNTNDLNETNSRYGITVGGINAQTDLSSLIVSPKPFSTQGETILVSAPASNVVSTGAILTSSTGTIFGSDYAASDGTSFATPIVSGIVALMLEANPNLGYRDVQAILAYSAHKVNDPTTSWQVNLAKNWNGGGLHYSRDYGFGEVDARAAVRLAETWQGQRTASNLYIAGPSLSQTTTVGNGAYLVVDSTGPHVQYTNTFSVSFASSSTGLRAEYVEVYVDLDIDAYPLSDIKVMFEPLRATSVELRYGNLVFIRNNYSYDDGLASVLLDGEQSQPSSSSYVVGADGHRHLQFVYGTVKYRGQEFGGDPWVLRIIRKSTGQEVTPTANWSVRFMGTPSTEPQQWIFTDEYSGGAIITPATTTDSFNAAAATGNNVIDLRTGTADSLINGRSVTVNGNLSKGFGGDGNDTIYGNSGDNSLVGGRGDDVLTGDAGNDTLDGGSGTDTATYSGTYTQYAISTVGGVTTVTDTVASRDGVDTLTGMDFLRFADRTVAVDKPPTAHNDSGSVSEDATVSFAVTSLLANDTSANVGDILTLVSVETLSANGAAVSILNGNVVYDPRTATALQAIKAGSGINDTFNYTIRNAAGQMSSATVAVTVTGANDAPVALDDSWVGLNDGGVVTLSAARLLGNDTDRDANDSKAFFSVSSTSANGASVSIVNGNVVYDPGVLFRSLQPGQAASDTFSYTMRDAAGGTSSATVAMTIIGPFDATLARGVERIGMELLVNSNTSSDQTSPAVSGLSNGNFIVSWADLSGTVGDNWGTSIKAQLYNANGAKLGGEFLINSQIAGYQDNPAIGALVGGGFVATWESNGIKAQIFDGAGSKTGAELLVGQTGWKQIKPTVTGLSSGNFVVSWQDGYYDGDQYLLGTTSSFSIQAQIYDGSGNAVGGRFQVNDPTANHQEAPAITALANGGFVVTWQSDSDWKVKTQLFDANGNKVGAEIAITDMAGSRQLSPAITALADGGFVVSWSDDSNRIGAQVFNAAGQRVGDKLQVAIPTGYAIYSGNPTVALANGGFVVTWTDSSGTFGDSNGSAIMAQAFDASGNKVGVEFLVNSQTAGYQINPVIAGLSNGGFVVSWQDGDTTNPGSTSLGDSSGTSIKAQIFGLNQLNWVSGTSGDDILSGTPAPDVLIGGGGRDIYRFDAGGGHDVIVNGLVGSSVPTGRLELGPGLSPSKLWFSRSDNDLLVSVLGSSDQIAVKGWYASSSSSLQALACADGTEIGASAIASLAAVMGSYQATHVGFDPRNASSMPTDANIQASLNASWIGTVTGGSGNDILRAGPFGQYTLVGAGGYDTYQFSGDAGQQLAITNGPSVAGLPHGKLLLSADLDPSNLWLNRSGNDLAIQVLGKTGRATLKDWFSNPSVRLDGLQFSDGSFIITTQMEDLAARMTSYQASHSSFDASVATELPADLVSALNGSWARVLTGTSNDTIKSGLGHSIFFAGTGNETLVGGNGSNGYFIDRISGQLRITETSAIGDDTILFGSAIDPARLWFGRTGNDLVIQQLGSSNQIAVTDWFNYPLSFMWAYDFSTNLAGLSMSTAQIQATVTAMTNYRAAHPAFNPQTATGLPDDTGIANALRAYGLWVGTSGNDSLNLGNVGGGIIDGGLGNDTLNASGGPTYLFGANSGQDVVYANGGRLQLGAGLNPDNLWFTRYGGDLVILVLGSSSRLTVSGWFTSAGNQFGGGIHLADGSSMSASAATNLANTFWSTASISFAQAETMTKIPDDPVLQQALATNWSRILVNYGGTATLDGHRGNNGLMSFGGDPTYVFGRGDGQVTIINGQSIKGSAWLNQPYGELDLGPGISADDVWLQRRGDDLGVHILGTSDDATIAGWYTAGQESSRLSRIKLADSGAVLDTKLDQLIQAMETYSAQHTAFNPTSSFFPQAPKDPVLQNAIAAAWHS